MSDQLTDAEGYILVPIRLVDLDVLLDGYGTDQVPGDNDAYRRACDAWEAAGGGHL